MSTPDVESIQRSVDSLFEEAPGNPQYGEVYTSPRSKDGSTLEGIFVPYGFAIRGFKEMEEFKRAHLGLRRVKNSQLVIARHIVELSLEEPYDEEKDLGTNAAEHYVVDRGRLFMMPTDRQRTLDRRVRDIGSPLEPGRGLKLASASYVALLGRKMLSVAEAASTRDEPVLEVASAANAIVDQ